MQWLGFEANLNSSFLISHHFATKWYLHGTSQMLKRNRELEESDPYTDVEEDKDELENELVLEDC